MADNNRLRREAMRAGASVLWFGLCAWLMSIAQIMGDERLVKFQQSLGAMAALPDLGLTVLPHPDGWPKWMADITLNSFLVISLLSWAGACWWWKSNGSDNRLRMAVVRWLVLVRRGFWLFGGCYFLRMLSLLGTTLPSSNPHCVLKARESIWEWISTGPLILVGKAQTCTDKLFSGHTCLATLLISFWLLRNVTSSPNQRRRVLSAISRVYAMMHGCAVWVASLMCRHHYTVDIVLAIIVSSCLFHLYHLLVWIAQSSIASPAHIGYSHIIGLDRPVKMDLEHGLSYQPMIESNDTSEIAYQVHLPTVSVRHPLESVLWLITWLDGIDLRV